MQNNRLSKVHFLSSQKSKASHFTSKLNTNFQHTHRIFVNSTANMDHNETSLLVIEPVSTTISANHNETILLVIEPVSTTISTKRVLWSDIFCEQNEKHPELIEGSKEIQAAAKHHHAKNNNVLDLDVLLRK